MKVIDLLNKIANGEEVPKKIEYRNDIYILTDNYCYYCKETNLILSDRLYAEQSRLNDEVEILEEEKKIPEKLETYKDKNNEIFLDDLCYKYMPIHKDSLSFNEQVIVDKLNEIIDYLHYLKSKGE